MLINLSRKSFYMLSLFGLIVACGGKSEQINLEGSQKGSDLTVATASLQKLNALQKALGLDGDPAGASTLWEEKYFGELKTKMDPDTQTSSCTGIQIAEASASENKFLYLLRYTISKSTESRYALLSLPKNQRKSLLTIYNQSGHSTDPYPEMEEVFGTLLNELVVAAPYNAGIPFTFNSKKFSNPASTTTFLDDVTNSYGLTICLQKNAASLNVGNGTLAQNLVTAENGFIRTVSAGSGVGSLISSLQVGRSGAWNFPSAQDEKSFAKYQCQVQINPFYSIYGAEGRLILRALVSGTIDQTGYAYIPGIKQLDSEFFAKYRQGAISADALASEIAKRDSYFAAFFANLGLKDYGANAEPGKMPAGGQLILHSRDRYDYQVNQSRIYANLQSNIQLKLVDMENSGIRFLYREYDDVDGPQNSFKNIISNSFKSSRGQMISEYFTKTSLVPGRESEYRWFIRGRSDFTESVDKTPSDTLRLFLSKSCGF